MRISLLAIGSTGDVRPMALLGRELALRGHQVTLSAFAALSPLAAEAGISFKPLPGDAALFIGSIIKPGANPLTYLRRLIASLHDVLELMLDAMYAEFLCADIVVTTFFGATPYAMAEKAGVPLYQVHFSPLDPTGLYCLPVMRSLPLGRAFNLFLYHLAFRMIGRVEKRYAHPWCARNGLPRRRGGARPDYRIGDGEVSVLYAFSEHIVPRAPEWGSAIRQVGCFQEPSPAFDPPEALQAFLDAGEPPLYIGFGSMTSGDADECLRTILGALKRTGLRAVLSAGWSAINSAEFPDTVYCIREFVPHNWLFSRVRAVVHHGGAGTTAAGLLAGAPTLVVPFGSDQFFWGERVHALGCGPKPLARSRLSARALSGRLAQLVSQDAYRRNAEAMAARLQKEQGVRLAADIIEQGALRAQTPSSNTPYPSTAPQRQTLGGHNCR